MGLSEPRHLPISKCVEIQAIPKKVIEPFLHLLQFPQLCLNCFIVVPFIIWKFSKFKQTMNSDNLIIHDH